MNRRKLVRHAVQSVLAAAVLTVAVPTSASAAATGYVHGASYQACNIVRGDYGYSPYREKFDGFTGYDTWGSVTLSYDRRECGSWNTDIGWFQYTGYVWVGGEWLFIPWTSKASPWGEVSLDFEPPSRDLRFRVCNNINGKPDGCGRVQ
ncbi:hypothetical protein [Streptomyces sp. NPDC059862]|uniref:hypothetical protein n=1 Tax=unclassified Streptomyces TaxID=2593676 RepID=UPI0036252F06